MAIIPVWTGASNHFLIYFKIEDSNTTNNQWFASKFPVSDGTDAEVVPVFSRPCACKHILMKALIALCEGFWMKVNELH